MGPGVPDSPGALEGSRSQVSGNPRGADSAPAIPTRSKTGRKGAGPNAFPRRPQEMNFSEQSWAVARGYQESPPGQGPQDFRHHGYSPAPVSSNLSLNAPRQGLYWVQSSRPCLQKQAGEGKGDREELEALAQLLPEASALQGSLQTWALRGIRKQGDVCTGLSIAPHKRAHPGESVRKTAWVPAARLPGVVSDAPLRGALTAAAALPWGPASRRRGTDNELLARLPAQLASVEPAGSAGARVGSSAWARGEEEAPGLLSLRVPE